MEGVCVAVWVLLIHLGAVCNGPILVSCVHHVHFYAFASCLFIWERCNQSFSLLTCARVLAFTCRSGARARQKHGTRCTAFRGSSRATCRGRRRVQCRPAAKAESSRSAARRTCGSKDRGLANQRGRSAARARSVARPPPPLYPPVP